MDESGLLRLVFLANSEHSDGSSARAESTTSSRRNRCTWTTHSSRPGQPQWVSACRFDSIPSLLLQGAVSLVTLRPCRAWRSMACPASSGSGSKTGSSPRPSATFARASLHRVPEVTLFEEDEEELASLRERCDWAMQDTASLFAAVDQLLY